MMVNAQAAAKARLSPKLSKVAAMEPMRMENSSQDRKVRSVASWTFGSTRTGTWMPDIKLVRVGSETVGVTYACPLVP
jgi:hypothetical protein